MPLPTPLPIDQLPVAVVPVTQEDVTTLEMDGTGMFDHLMSAVQLRLDKAYKQKHITGPDYARVFIELTSAVMAQATQFALNKQNSANQAALVDVQRIKVEQDIINASLQQALLDEQILNAKIEGRLMKQKFVTELAQTSDSIPTYNHETGAFLSTDNTVDGVIGKTKADVNQKTINAAATKLVIDEQLIKVKKEKLLLQQKIATEQAQTSGAVHTFDSAGAVENGGARTNITAGVIFQENRLREQQTKGFQRDSEQKITKMMLDAWIVRFSQDPASALPTSSGVGDLDIKGVVDTAVANSQNNTFTE